MSQLSAEPSSRGGPIIAWAVILIISGFLFVSHLSFGPADDEASNEAPDPQFELAAKMYLGARTFGPQVAKALGSSPTHSAKTPTQKFSAAILEGETTDAEAAIKRLNELDAEPHLSEELRRDIDHVHQIYALGATSLEPAHRQRLLDRQGFFARLALSFERPDADPIRQAVLRECRRLAMVMIAAGAVILGLGAVGLVLFIFALVKVFDGTIRRAYVPNPAAPGVYVEMFAVYLVCFIGISALIPVIAGGGPALPWMWLASIVVPIAFLWGMLRGVSWPELRYSIGWHAGRGALREIVMGVVGYLAGLPVVAGGLFITAILLSVTKTTATHPIQSVPLDSVRNALMLYGIASLWAPVIEETMFRGVLFHHLRRRWGFIFSAAIVALIFAAVHPQGSATIPALGSIAIVLAALREWRGSILAPITAHALNNGLVITLLVALKWAAG
jgi:membrane protease YdiL (CAAX protease family)